MASDYIYTKYPNSIDTSNEIPKATDNVTKVDSEIVNRYREAILAIEGELGIQPSGTYATVRARLDALDLSGSGSGSGGNTGTARQIVDASNMQTISSYDGYWQVNSIAPLSLSTDDGGIIVRLFEDFNTDGAGFFTIVASGVTQLTFNVLARPREFSSSDSTTITIYARSLSESGGPGSWTQIATQTQNYTNDNWTITTLTANVTPFQGKYLQLEITRSSGTLGGWELSFIEIL